MIDYLCICIIASQVLNLKTTFFLWRNYVNIHYFQDIDIKIIGKKYIFMEMYFGEIIFISCTRTVFYLTLHGNALICQSNSHEDDTSFNQQMYFKPKIILF